MQYKNDVELVWDDYIPEGYNELNKKLKAVVSELLDNPGSGTRRWQAKHYIRYYIYVDKKQLFSEELVRFRRYLKQHYQL